MKTEDQKHQAQIAVLLQNYRASGLTRTEFRRRIGVPAADHLTPSRQSATLEREANVGMSRATLDG